MKRGKRIISIIQASDPYVTFVTSRPALDLSAVTDLARRDTTLSP